VIWNKWLNLLNTLIVESLILKPTKSLSVTFPFLPLPHPR
jgi:hypothetical protein